MTKYYLIHLGLYLLAAAGLCLCNIYEPAWVTEKLRARLLPEAEQLIPSLDKIKSHLKLRDYASAVEIYQRIKDIRKDKGFDWKTCIGSESKKKLTLDRLISLRSLVEQCELDSLEEFERFELASRKSKLFQSLIYKMVSNYRLEHALACGPIYKRNYVRFVANLNDQERQNYELVHRNLGLLGMSDFDKLRWEAGFYPTGEQRQRLIIMRAFDIETQFNMGLFKIVLQIGRRLFRIPEWSSIMRPEPDQAKLKAAFDEHLFEPCAAFRRTLGPVLEPTLVVATIYEAKRQYDFIAEDRTFFEDMFEYALCGKLLDKRDQLFEKFSMNWRAASPHQFAEQAR